MASIEQHLFLTDISWIGAIYACTYYLYILEKNTDFIFASQIWCYAVRYSIHLQGINGRFGLPGAKGDVGMVGDRGQKGEPGIGGRQGDPGVPGTPGRNGDPGDKGEKGAMGIPGKGGLKGMRGEKAEPGMPGTGQIVSKYWFQAFPNACRL